MDRLDAWVAVQERGDPQRVVRMGAHPVRQRADAAANEPAVERRRHGAAEAWTARMRIEVRVASPGHDGAAEHSPWPPRYFVVACSTRSAPSLRATGAPAWPWC